MNKLTILVEHDVYQGLYEKVGKGNISKYINDMIKPFVIEMNDVEHGYKAMSMDLEREKEAEAWIEGTVSDLDTENVW